MPFVAKRKGTGERIDITLIENPRGVLKQGECICQVCDTQVKYPCIECRGLVSRPPCQWKSPKGDYETSLSKLRRRGV